MFTVVGFATKKYRIWLDAIKDNYRYRYDREAFKPYGISVFFGEQGSGKTLTMIEFMLKVKKRYPKAILFSNVELSNYQKVPYADLDSLSRAIDQVRQDSTNKYIYYQDKDQYLLCMSLAQNGKYGVVFVTDEYQNYFSNQDSRNVPPAIIEQAAQNRKQARLHLVTSQDYDQMVKAIRRRCSDAIKCRTFSLPLSYGPLLSVYWFYDAKKLDFTPSGKLIGRARKIGWYFHSRALRSSFDTHQVIVTGDSVDNVYAAQPPTSILGDSTKRRPSPLRSRMRRPG